MAVTESKLPISVCYISGPEAHRISDSLESITSWTSEIIVVLNEEVTDGTDAVAARFKAKVFREPWRGFIEQKNSALAKATCPWVLSLDADEVVGPELKNEIIRLISGGEANASAFSFPRCTYYCGRWIRHGDWYPDRVIRLWKRGSARWAGIEPHARVEVTGSLARLRHDLLHFSNESIDRQISKIAPYSNDFVNHRLAQGKFPGLFDLAVRPVWKFLRAYLFKLGFLDGWQGYYIAWLSAFSTATRYIKILEATRKKSGL